MAATRYTGAGVYALEFGWAFYEKRNLSLSTYATVNTIDFDGFGDT